MGTGTEVGSPITDLDSADSLASDMTYRLFVGLAVVNVEKGRAWLAVVGKVAYPGLQHRQQSCRVSGCTETLNKHAST